MQLPADSEHTLIDALAQAAAHRPDRGIGLIDARGERAEHRTYPDLLVQFHAAAARLRALGIAPREPLLCCLPTGFPFLTGWFGAVYAGAWPCALAPFGGLGSAEHHFDKMRRIADALGARVLCTESGRDEARSLGLDALADGALTPERLAEAAPAAGFVPAAPMPDDIAFLQLTSGSTGLPRAVMVRHRSAVHNALAIRQALGAPLPGGVLPPDSTGVSWLPLHHDMGLVGMLFCSLLSHADIWLQSPKSFLGRPQTWLQNLGAHPAAMTAAPNFAYNICVERVPERKLAGLDLSRWRAAMIGAEMTRPESIAAFVDKFAPFGFDPRVFRSCYGLAEATLAVTFDRQGRGIRTRAAPAGAALRMGLREIASVGAPIADTRVEVRAPDGAPCPDGAVGELFVDGPGVFAGYHGDPDATAEALCGGWLRTGDLGFFADGELWITGRLKDILIINGENLMPHELEGIAEAVVGGGGTSRAAAISVGGSTGGEQPVLVVETGDGDPAAAEREIRSRIGRALGVTLGDVAFVRRGSIPKTTSGKVQRAELTRRYVAGELERLAREDPA